nr:NIPSNAP family protein [Bernardetiaceae bacterium]
YELRIYTAAPGKMDALLARFQNHALKHWPKYGIKLEGFWLPLEAGAEAKLYYLVSYADMAARERAWRDFQADPKWQKAVKKSEKAGAIISKVEEIYLQTTDFSPNQWQSVGNRVFELRIYHAYPNRLPDVLARFRNHTVKLFEKHGMQNLVYFTSIPQKADEASVLYYFLAHRDQAAGKASFDTFVKDPAWIQVRDASEANGKILERLVSVYMRPVAFSPWK